MARKKELNEKYMHRQHALYDFYESLSPKSRKKFRDAICKQCDVSSATLRAWRLGVSYIHDESWYFLQKEMSSYSHVTV